MQIYILQWTAQDHHYTPRFNEVERGVYWYHLVRLWTESWPLCIFNNIHRIHFIFAHPIKQLQKVCRVKFWRIFKICNFDFVFFWLGIQYDSMVWWVIIRWHGVSLKRRRFSCSSWFQEIACGLSGLSNYLNQCLLIIFCSTDQWQYTPVKLD